ncbi:hypothetical protein FE784_20700 [Paenibacillus hemerocallicola]|uniref:Uncharacterized protein n=1 Tax=Paenibacillus hemerocallicola TaxID=1172614 RepID=A0A5C4T7V2_9BACL|nr:hypothetical protein [Paenibacillus hemerocallicola]TNJ64389.1 hypothetical protein FE784_20700 [Paenibacillus hemerocallicola]
MDLAGKEKINKKKRTKFFLVELVKKRWPSFVALAIAATGLPASTDPMSLILFLAALFYPISGAIRGHLRGGRTILIQAIALVFFGVIALVSVYVDRDTGLILLAAGYIGHTIWDIAHFRTGRIVRRGYAEFCAVLDLLIAAVLLAPIFM